MVRSLLDIIANTLFFIIEPLSMIKLLWQLCVRIVCFLTFPWFGIFKFIFNIYVDVCWRFILLGIAAFSIPIRLFTALHREKEVKDIISLSSSFYISYEGAVPLNSNDSYQSMITDPTAQPWGAQVGPFSLSQYSTLPKNSLEYLPKFSVDANQDLDDHIKAITIACGILGVQEENVFVRLFVGSLIGRAADLFQNLPDSCITCWNDFELEAHLYELQIQLEGLTWANKDLEQRLDVAIKNYRRTENLLAEAEEEEDRALEKILLLETRIREIEAENLRLKEIEERALFEAATTNNDETSNMKEPNGNGSRKHLSHLEDEDCYRSELGDVFEKKGKILSDYVLGKGRSFPSYESRTVGIDPLLEDKMKLSGHFSLTKKREINDKVIYQWRGAAIAQSTFSACLSLLVGMITWEAQDPCMPLVIALFIVVGMSLNSVVKFFSRIENRPGSDAVALLSFNWFILGTLASPTLPNVARLLVPWLSDFGHRTANWFGFEL